jgi:hypothetical protein
LGDYVDSFFVPPVEQLFNLKNLITFLRKNKDNKIHALLGNHDFAYLYGYSGISGYQYQHFHEYKQIFQDNLDLFQIAWGYTNEITKKYTLATHAGLTQRFWDKFILPEFKEGKWLHQITKGEKPENLSIHETLNYLRDKGDIIWKVGSVRGGVGTPSPLWADYTELIEDPYERINQVFGHTPRVSVTLNHIGDEFYACIDNWGNKKIASMIITL